MSDQVTKIYELRTLGYGEINKELQDIAKRFQEIKKAKQEAGKVSGTGTQKTESEEIKKQKEAVAALRVEEQKLKVERQQLMKEAKALQLARQQEINQLRQQKASAQGAAGSYTALYNEYKQLYKLVKDSDKVTPIDFRGQTLQYDQAIAKLKELAAAEQDFRRQFSRDSLLVGEYTSGIVQAFKQMGLDDLVGGQIQKANDRLGALDNEFNDLQQSLSKIRVTGEGSFEAIEKQLIENRREAIALQQQVGNLEKEFRSAGDVGDRLTAALGRGFRDLKGQVAQFALTYLSLQALLTTGQQAFDNTVQLDSLDASLELVSGSTQELAINQEFLTRITERLGVQYVQTAQAFKNFYAASTLAGIGAQETRDIFEAAVASAARLKLSQEDTNSVLLAFGQIASKGKVQAEELRGQIGERVPGAFSIAAKAIGVTQQQLNKMLENGEVIASEFLPKFAAELQRTFGGNTTERVEGLQAGINRLKNQFTDLVRENQQGLTKFFELLVAIGGGLFAIIGFITGLPFPILIGGLTAATTALALYKAEQIRAYVATQIASQQGLIYNTVLLAQRAAMLAYSLAVRAATAQIVLFNGAIRVSPLGLLLTTLGLVIPVLAVFAAKVSDARARLDALTDVQRRSNQISSQQIGRIDALRNIIRSTATSIDTKRKALDELIKINPAFVSALDGQTISLTKLEQAYRQVTAAIRVKANAEASAALSAEKNAEVIAVSTLRQRIEQEAALTPRGQGATVVRLSENERQLANDVLGEAIRNNGRGGIVFTGNDFKEIITTLKKEEEKRIRTYQEYLNVQAKAEAELAGLTGKTTAVATQSFDIDIKALQERKKALDDQISGFQGTSQKFNALKAERAKIDAQLDDLLNGSKSSTRGSGRASKSENPEEKRRKLIEEVLKQQLADLRLSFLNQEITEEQYLNNVLEANRTAYREKLNLVKGSSAEELAAIAELKAAQKQLEIDTSNQIFDIREKAIQDSFAQRKREIEANLTAVDDDPATSPLARAQARLDADKQLLLLQEQFNKDMDALEAQYSRQSVEKAFERAEAIKTINRNLSKDQVESLQSQLQKIQQDGRDAIARFQEQISAARLELSGKTGRERRRAEADLNQAETRGILGIEVESLNKQLPIYKELVDAKVKTDEEYLLLAKDLNDKAAQLNDTTVAKVDETVGRIRSLGDQLRQGLKNLFNFQEGSLEDGLLGDAISQSYDLARGAMNAYYDAEIQRIQQSKEANLERLDLERNQLLARAQSRDEELAIDKEYQAKKEEEERRAGERIKKVRKAEAKVALATELANIAVAAAQNPLNGITLGAAGIAMYGILAGLAVGRYALRVNEINRAEFEYGGQVPTETGGKITGPSHSAGGVPFNYEAEGGELAIVRTKNAGQGRYTISGTHTQIASALNKLGGGRDFFSGAKVARFEYGGSLGESLQAPVFTPAGSTAPGAIGQTLDMFGELLQRIDQSNAAVNQRIDRLEVVQVTSTVTSAQKKAAIQSEIGTL